MWGIYGLAEERLASQEGLCCLYYILYIINIIIRFYARFYNYTPETIVCRVSSVGIATRYGLDGPGIESRWRRDFPHPSRPALGPTHPPVQWAPGLSQG
jgi:hypothetical protein